MSHSPTAPLRVLSYNIHKGFSVGNRRFILQGIRETIRATGADLVLLQEVVGEHSGNEDRIEEWPETAQFEYLADSVWTHFAYGKNAVYPDGHHGNAILSRYPILKWENINVSTNRFEDRGLLHVVLDVPHHEKRPLHAICSHLGLFEGGRQKQTQWIADRIRTHVPLNDPLVIGGDFNDWRGNLTEILQTKSHLEEAFVASRGKHAKTFPSWMPALCLDRIYFRGMKLKGAKTHDGPPWSELSDHLALSAEFEF